MVDWNHNGQRDSFDFAMDMMAMEEMERGSSKKSSYNNSYKSSKNDSDDAFYMGCTMYMIFLIMGPLMAAFMFLVEGEGGIALGIIALGVAVNALIFQFVLSPQSSSSKSAGQAKSANKMQSSNGQIIYDTDADYRYTFRGQSVVITGYTRTDREVIKIPTMIQYQAVQHIESGAFRACSNLRKIIIPQYVEYIATDAFASTKNLTIYGQTNSYAQMFAKQNRIAFKDVKDFDESISYQNTQTQNDSVKTEQSKNNAASNPKDAQTKQPTAEYPRVERMGYYDVIVEHGSITMKAFVGIDKAVQTVPTIINDFPVRIIETGAYLNCKHIEKLIISEGIVGIRDGAFKGCDKLREVVIPRSVNTIGKDAFPHGQDIMIYCYGGSYGLDFARQYKYEYRDAEELHVKAPEKMLESKQKAAVKNASVNVIEKKIETKTDQTIVETKTNAAPNIEERKIVQKTCQDSVKTKRQLSTSALRKQDIADTEYGKIIYADTWTFVFRAVPRYGDKQSMNQQCKENKALVYWHNDVRDYVYFEYISGCELFIDGQRKDYCGKIPMNPYSNETMYYNVSLPRNGIILRFVTGEPRTLNISANAKILKEIYDTIAYVVAPSGQSPFATLQYIQPAPKELLIMESERKATATNKETVALKSSSVSSFATGLSGSTLLLDALDSSDDSTDWENYETARERLDFELIGTGYDSYDLEWMDEDDRDEILWDNGIDPFDYDFYGLDDID